tara:strand:- start:5367 stop:5504 length:138 start_codon:yes stop_codon:yes gene_type:complete
VGSPQYFGIDDMVKPSMLYQVEKMQNKPAVKIFFVKNSSNAIFIG